MLNVYLDRGNDNWLISYEPSESFVTAYSKADTSLSLNKYDKSETERVDSSIEAKNLEVSSNVTNDQLIDNQSDIISSDIENKLSVAGYFLINIDVSNFFFLFFVIKKKFRSDFEVRY